MPITPPASEPLSALSLEASLTVADVRRSADWYRSARFRASGRLGRTWIRLRDPDGFRLTISSPRAR